VIFMHRNRHVVVRSRCLANRSVRATIGAEKPSRLDRRILALLVAKG